MVDSLFVLVLVSGALTRLIVLHPLPLAAGLMAGHAAVVAGAGPVETFGAFALVATGVSATIGLLAEAPWRAVRWPVRAIQAAASLAPSFRDWSTPPETCWAEGTGAQSGPEPRIAPQWPAMARNGPQWRCACTAKTATPPGSRSWRCVSSLPRSSAASRSG